MNLCNCGKKIFAKKLCANCYQKQYKFEKYGIVTGDKKTHDFDEKYKQVLKFVELGYSISKACSKSKVSKSWLYNNLDDKQLKELTNYKLLNQKHIITRF